MEEARKISLSFPYLYRTDLEATLVDGQTRSVSLQVRSYKTAAWWDREREGMSLHMASTWQTELGISCSNTHQLDRSVTRHSRLLCHPRMLSRLGISPVPVLPTLGFAPPGETCPRLPLIRWWSGGYPMTTVMGFEEGFGCKLQSCKAIWRSNGLCEWSSCEAARSADSSAYWATRFIFPDALTVTDDVGAEPTSNLRLGGALLTFTPPFCDCSLQEGLTVQHKRHTNCSDSQRRKLGLDLLSAIMQPLLGRDGWTFQKFYHSIGMASRRLHDVIL